MSFNSPIYSSFESQEFNKCRIGIIKSSWNNKITDLLYNSAHSFLIDSGVQENNIFKSCTWEYGISLYVKLFIIRK